MSIRDRRRRLHDCGWPLYSTRLPGRLLSAVGRL